MIFVERYYLFSYSCSVLVLSLKIISYISKGVMWLISNFDYFLRKMEVGQVVNLFCSSIYLYFSTFNQLFISFFSSWYSSNSFYEFLYCIEWMFLLFSLLSLEALRQFLAKSKQPESEILWLALSDEISEIWSIIQIPFNQQLSIGFISLTAKLYPTCKWKCPLYSVFLGISITFYLVDLYKSCSSCRCLPSWAYLLAKLAISVWMFSVQAKSSQRWLGPICSTSYLKKRLLTYYNFLEVIF